MGEFSWALEAIEKEAVRRATAELLKRPTLFSYMGVQPPQLAWLIHDYEARTGQSARELDPNTPLATGVS